MLAYLGFLLRKNMNWGGKSNKAWKVRSFFASHIIVQNSDMINQFYPKFNKITLIPRGIDLNEFISRSDVQEIVSLMNLIC